MEDVVGSEDPPTTTTELGILVLPSVNLMVMVGVVNKGASKLGLMLLGVEAIIYW